MLIVYSKNNCPECAKAIALLDAKGIPYKVEKVEENEHVRPFLIAMGHRAVPQIYDVVGDDNTYIGDYKTLTKLTDEELQLLNNLKKVVDGQISFRHTSSCQQTTEIPMWKLFKKLFEEEQPKQEIVVEPATPVPQEELIVFEETPVKKWREPVQVLIDSIEEGWWDVSIDRHSGYRSWSDYFTFKHEWLQTSFLLSKHDTYNFNSELKSEWSVSENWMSSEEKDAVAASAKEWMSKLNNLRRKRAEEVREGEFFKLLNLKEIL